MDDFLLAFCAKVGFPVDNVAFFDIVRQVDIGVVISDDLSFYQPDMT